ncbi:ABC-type sugar transport system, periplasmic component [Opitutaceae bacterium TAV1]|nr:ABC-type sugar transport system, periplasmic component [Opitutaceae bacterium TAV1]
MKRILPWIGLCLLLAAFATAALRVFNRTRISADGEAADTAAIHLRFAHVTIHEGIVRSYDDAIREYERLNPGVRVEQIRVPLKLWASWLRTQMVGGTAPDIADMDRGQADEFLARFFLPLDPWTEQPNPWNAGTPLEGVPWRDTFIDGLVSAPAYRASLQQVYGIPLTVGTVRVFANAELLRQITGSEEPPRDYAAFMELCHRIRDYARERGVPIVPVAGSQTHALPILRHLFASQTQKLALQINPYQSLAFSARDVALGYLRGDWNWSRTPAVMDGVAIMGEVGRQTVEGFAQLQREDSMFYFTQRRAVMLATGSWEADTVIAQTPFRLTAFTVPVPLPEDPQFGRNVLGPVSELGIPPGNAMGVTRASLNADRAVDFLRFLTSQSVSQRVMTESNRLSSVVGVTPPPGLEVFEPLSDGWPSGFSCELTGVAAGGPGECSRIYRGQLHELVGPRGSAENFARVMDELFPEAVRADLRSAIRDTSRNSRAEDGVLTAFWLAPGEGDDARASRLREAQTLRELEAAQMEYGLKNWTLSAERRRPGP